MSNLHRFEIYLPDNSHTQAAQCDKFSEWSLQYFGGFTQHAHAYGAWLDDTGARHDDRVRPYELALQLVDVGRATDLAFELFPAELALYVVVDGKPEIINRPSLSAPALATLRDGRHDRGWRKL